MSVPKALPRLTLLLGGDIYRERVDEGPPSAEIDAAEDVPDDELDDLMASLFSEASNEDPDGNLPDTNAAIEESDVDVPEEDDDEDDGEDDDSREDDDASDASDDLEGRIGDFDEASEPKAPVGWDDYTFCPAPHRKAVQKLAMLHFTEHPLLCNWRHGASSSSDQIYERQAREMYTFCKRRNLREVWAYLWTSWYRRRMWDIWARASAPDFVSRLRTTMTAENHWKVLKHHYLRFATRPRLDHTLFVLIFKVAPAAIDRASTLAEGYVPARPFPLTTFQVALKKSWNTLAERPLGSNRAYNTNLALFSCDCGGQALQAQGLCKHLVHAAGSAPLEFFYRIYRRRIQPIYQDPFLKNTSPEFGTIADGDDEKQHLIKRNASPLTESRKRAREVDKDESEAAPHKRVEFGSLL